MLLYLGVIEEERMVVGQRKKEKEKKKEKKRKEKEVCFGEEAQKSLEQGKDDGPLKQPNGREGREPLYLCSSTFVPFLCLPSFGVSLGASKPPCSPSSSKRNLYLIPPRLNLMKSQIPLLNQTKKIMCTMREIQSKLEKISRVEIDFDLMKNSEKNHQLCFLPFIFSLHPLS